jgi:hypothetical protein
MNGSLFSAQAPLYPNDFLAGALGPQQQKGWHRLRQRDQERWEKQRALERALDQIKSEIEERPSRKRNSDLDPYSDEDSEPYSDQALHRQPKRKRRKKVNSSAGLATENFGSETSAGLATDAFVSETSNEGFREIFIEKTGEKYYKERCQTLQEIKTQNPLDTEQLKRFIVFSSIVYVQLNPLKRKQQSNDEINLPTLRVAIRVTKNTFSLDQKEPIPDEELEKLVTEYHNKYIKKVKLK